MPSTGTGIRFRLLGVPIAIGPSIVLILALFGFGIGDLVALGLWVVIGIVSIVLHELGHALVARAAGASPTIQLAGLGGVTRYEPTERSSRRGWSLAISLAGPAVGLGIGAVAWLLRGTLDSGYGGVALEILLFTSIGWSIFNLLPILPLDGGQALRELLPGDDRTRTVRAAWTGLVTAIIVAALAIWQEQIFIALFAGLFASQNYRIATASKAAERDREQLRDLFDAEDWRGIRDALAEGRGGIALARAAQVRAGAAGQFQVAAEIGEVALERGSDDPDFARRSAAAWRELGLDDRARQMDERASELEAR